MYFFSPVDDLVSGKQSVASSEWVGYLVMIVALSTIFFGIKYYKDKQSGGTITFGKAFLVGLYIALVASVLYVVGWELYLKFHMPDFMDKYTQMTQANMQSKGASATEISEKMAELNRYKEWYKNPILRYGMTLMEILPVGLLISLISAAILRTKNKKFTPQTA